jgi:hypothetical protein
MVNSGKRVNHEEHEAFEEEKYLLPRMNTDAHG